MAVGWLTVLQSVPWSDVIANAPKVAEGARKLWNTVARKQPADAQAGVASSSTPARPGDAAALQAQVSALEATVSELHGQMLASSELIKTLADQNTQLIARIEANRRRTLWLSVAVAVLAVVAIGALLLAAQRGA
jgi:hypothetical protein